MDDSDSAYAEAHMESSLSRPDLLEMIKVVDGEVARMASSIRVVSLMNDGRLNLEAIRHVVVMEYVLKKLIEFQSARKYR